MRILHLIAVAFCLTLISFSAQAQNQQLPSVELKDMEGAKINVQDAVKEGRITVISFWATWCSPCKRELDNLVDFYADWRDQGIDVEIIAVSTDDSRTATRVKSTVDSKGWEYTILLDTNQDFQRAMSVANVPFTFVIDQNGEIVYSHSGYIEGDEYELEEKVMALVKDE